VLAIAGDRGDEGRSAPAWQSSLIEPCWRRTAPRCCLTSGPPSGPLMRFCLFFSFLFRASHLRGVRVPLLQAHLSTPGRRLIDNARLVWKRRTVACSLHVLSSCFLPVWATERSPLEACRTRWGVGRSEPEHNVRTLDVACSGDEPALAQPWRSRRAVRAARHKADNARTPVVACSGDDRTLTQSWRSMRPVCADGHTPYIYRPAGAPSVAVEPRLSDLDSACDGE